MNKAILIIVAASIEILTGCSNNNYTYEDVEITGTITKQYVETCGSSVAYTNYFTVVDYGDDNFEIIDDKNYFLTHDVGDEVKLIKRLTYKDKKRTKTEIKWE